MRRILAAAVLAAALAAPVAQAGHRDEFVKEPTAVGSGGAAGTVDALATKAAIDTLQARRQRGRRDGGGGRRARRDRAVLGRHRRRRLHGHPHAAAASVTTIDGREKAPAAMRPDSFFENGAALAFDAGALERPVGRRAGHRRAVGRGARPLRHDLAAQGAAAGHRGRPPRLHRRPDLRRPDDAVRRLLQRRPVDGGDLPRPGRHAARRRQHAAQPGPGAHVRADRAVTGRAPSTAGRSRARSPARRAEAADRRRRQPRLAARPDDRARPARATTPSGASRRASATRASTSGAWARRRAAARPSARR